MELIRGAGKLDAQGSVDRATRRRRCLVSARLAWTLVFGLASSEPGTGRSSPTRSASQSAVIALLFVELNSRVIKRYGKSRRELLTSSIVPRSHRCAASTPCTGIGRTRRSGSMITCASTSTMTPLPYTHVPTHFDVRAIATAKGLPPRTLWTALVEVKRDPAAELPVLSHKRWEVELGFGELETDMRKRLEAIRSRSPEPVTQERWGSSWPTTWCASKCNVSATRPAARHRASVSLPRFA